ncbi:MAG TPA: hypothetical protein VGM01_01385 [Ktedonobacteraceae bacterium]
MTKKQKRHHRRRVIPWWCRIPRPIWIVLEVLMAIVVTQEMHVSPDHLLLLFKWFAMR